MIEIVYQYETIQDANTVHSKSCYYALIILQVMIRMLSQIEKEEDVAEEQIKCIAKLVRIDKQFYVNGGLNDILHLIKEGFQYNVPHSFIHSYSIATLLRRLY